MRKLLFVCLLLAPLSGLSAKETVSESVLSAHREIIQVKLDAMKESIQKEREKLEQRLDMQDKRISDLALNLTLLGALLTVLALIAAYIGLVSVSNRAREEARKSADSWFADKGIEAKTELWERQLNDSRRSVEGLAAQVETLAKTAGAHFSDIEDTRRKAGELMEGLQQRMTSIDNARNISVDANRSPVEGATALAVLDEATKSKPESEYSFDDWKTRAFSAMQKDDFEGAAHYWLAAAESPRSSDRQVALALNNAAYALGSLGRHERAINVLDSVIKRFGASTNRKIQLQVARALVTKGIRLSSLHRLDEEMDCYSSAIERFSNHTDPKIQQVVATATLFTGQTLATLDQRDKAISCYDSIVSRYGENHHPFVQTVVAKALISKGLSLGVLDRIDEQLAQYDQLESLFHDATDAALKREIARALVLKAEALRNSGRLDEAVRLCERVDSEFKEQPELGIEEQVAKALRIKARALGMLEDRDGAIRTLDEVTARYGQRSEKQLRVAVAQAKNLSGDALLHKAKRGWLDAPSRQEHLRAAEKLFSEARSEHPEEHQVVGNLAYVAFLLGKIEQARLLLAEALRNGGRSLFLAAQADTEVAPVPDDGAYSRLLTELWAKIESENSEPKRPEDKD